MPRQIEIHIDKLVLHGFSPHDRHRIGDAVQEALKEYFNENNIPESLTHGRFAAHIDAGTFRFHGSQPPKETGENIASAVYKGLANED